MKALFAAACLAACCMGNLPLPGDCRGQLLNDQSTQSYLQVTYGNHHSDNAKRCEGGA